MPSGQAMLDALVASGAITYDPGAAPLFQVSYRLLRAVLQPEQQALATAQTINRTDTGTMTLTPISGGSPVVIPATLIIGADGTQKVPKGIGVALTEPTANGSILIAAGGNGGSAGPGGKGGDGGDASVTANAENLLIALGGRGGDGFTASALPGVNGCDGGAAGNAVIIGLGADNGCWAQCDVGGTGSAATMGTPPVAGLALFGHVSRSPIIASPNGVSGAGGCGGSAFATSGRGSYLDVRASDRGKDGPILPAYPPATAPPSLGGTVTHPPGAGNVATAPNSRCSGGDATVVLAPNSSTGYTAGLPNGVVREGRRP